MHNAIAGVPAGVPLNPVYPLWAIGAAKHDNACNEEGSGAGHGVLQQRAGDEPRIFVHGLWGPYRHRPAFKLFEFPVTPHHLSLVDQGDLVVKGGKDIGIVHGGVTKDVRARVAQYPYLTETRNQVLQVRQRTPEEKFACC